MSMGFTHKTLLLVLSLLCTSIFIVATGHHGDLEFYLYLSGSSPRTGLMKVVVYPFSLITQNLDAICIMWGSVVVGLSIHLQRYLSKAACYLLLMLGPFLLMPSKESLVFLCCLISVSLYISGRKYFALLPSVILILVRPYYVPIVVILLIIGIRKKPIRLTIIYFLIIIGGLYLLFTSENMIDTLNGFVINYYQGALDAGTTDWDFIEVARHESNITNYFGLILFRCLMPVWMLEVGIAGKAYFIWYITIEIVSLRTIYLFIGNAGYKYLGFNSIILYLISLLPACVLLVTNAGSAVRYISLLPLILQIIACNFKRNSIF